MEQLSSTRVDMIIRSLVHEHFNVDAYTMWSSELATFFRYLPVSFLLSQDNTRRQAIDQYKESLS